MVITRATLKFISNRSSKNGLGNGTVWMVQSGPQSNTVLISYGSFEFKFKIYYLHIRFIIALFGEFRWPIKQPCLQNPVELENLLYIHVWTNGKRSYWMNENFYRIKILECGEFSAWLGPGWPKLTLRMILDCISSEWIHHGGGFLRVTWFENYSEHEPSG